jgi:hypothetical protein
VTPDGPNLRQLQLETAGTASWLLMDLLWMLEWAEMSTASGGLTLGLYAAVFRYIPRTLADWSANGAVALWVLMNLLWMLGDQFEVAWFKTAALWTVAVSFLLLGTAVWKGGLTGPILQRFRRFRFRPAGEKQ